LMKSRGQLTILGWRPLCPICNIPVEFPDMHEVIITRGQARGTRLAELGLLYVRENCVLVHPSICHVLVAPTREGQAKCIRYLLEHEGYSKIKAWLEQVKVVSGGIAHDAIRKLDALLTGAHTMEELASVESDPGRQSLSE
jgi:hypothetical protein